MNTLTRLECAEILQDISFRLSRFKTNQPGKLYNFRCPFCGDSKQNPVKARGYVYEVIGKNTLRYKCHNCGLSLSFLKFIKLLDEEYFQNVIYSRFKEKTIETTKSIGKNDESDHYLQIEQIPAEVRKIHEVKDYGISVETLRNKKPNHVALKYLSKRNVPESSYKYLYYTENLLRFVQSFCPDAISKVKSEDPRILIPFFLEDGESFSYVQARAITNSKVKYYSFYCTSEKNPRHRIYGLYKNPQQFDRIFVLEGPIDSLFIPNSIAAGGSSLEEVIEFFDENKLVFVFDNEPENREIFKKMRKIQRLGLRLVIWPKELKKYGKDINDLVKEGIPVQEIVQILNQNTFSGLEADFQLNINHK